MRGKTAAFPNLWEVGCGILGWPLDSLRVGKNFINAFSWRNSVHIVFLYLYLHYFLFSYMKSICFISNYNEHFKFRLIF